jgi:nucleoside diphosphate kinase
MTQADNLIPAIVDNVREAQNEAILYKELFSDAGAEVKNNQFLFFIKPEITVKNDSIQLEEILKLVFAKIDEFGFNIHDVKILTAKYLDQFNIIAQHYGVINQIASNAVTNMSEGAKEKFAEIFGKSVDKAQVLGGLEFLEKYPEFTPTGLDYLCQNIGSKKLAGGTYVVEVKLDDELVYVINGFHGRQLKQFTENGRSIIVMSLSSDTDWSNARSNFIGATDPTKANEGSLRRAFLDNKESLGLPDVSQGANGVHLSAGPVEALVELQRYNSNFSNGETKDFTEFSFGKQLAEAFDQTAVQSIVQNTNVDVAGKSTSVFDLTEEKNSSEALELLKEFF